MAARQTSGVGKRGEYSQAASSTIVVSVLRPMRWKLPRRAQPPHLEHSVECSQACPR